MGKLREGERETYNGLAERRKGGSEAHENGENVRGSSRSRRKAHKNGENVRQIGGNEKGAANATPRKVI